MPRRKVSGVVVKEIGTIKVTAVFISTEVAERLV
jgi:hypothetical protein